ncbi:MAG: hypothetical protein ACJAUD_000200 [Crocinitomicaceae bacterium]|jgi:hypothetical protein
MKGIVSTEFLELAVNESLSEIVQRVIDECEVDGIYASMDAYSRKNMFKMVGKLSEIKGITVPELLIIYGEYFFTTLSNDYHKFIEQSSLFPFLGSIEKYIHPEVLKLYQDPELPTFCSESKNEMLLNYMSSRKRSYLAIGLVKDTLKYYRKYMEIFKISKGDSGEKFILKIMKN